MYVCMYVYISSKELPEMQGNMVLIPSQEDALEKEMPTPLQYSCMEFPQTEELVWLQVQGVTTVGHNLVTKPPPPNSYNYIYAC